MYQDIEKIINEWDPVDLFLLAPKDEYKKEISEIVYVCENSINVSEIKFSKLIKMIFENSFGKELIFKSDELEIAKKIINII